MTQERLIPESQVREMLIEAVIWAGDNDAIAAAYADRVLAGLPAAGSLPVIETCGACPAHGVAADENGTDVDTCLSLRWAGGPPWFGERPIEQMSPPPSWCPLRHSPARAKESR